MPPARAAALARRFHESQLVPNHSCAWKDPTSEGGITAVQPRSILKKGRDSASINRTGSCIIGAGSVDYESVTIRRDGGIRRLDKRTSLRSLSVCVVDREPLARIRPVFPVELDKRRPVV